MFYVRSVTASSCFNDSFLISDATFMRAFAFCRAPLRKPRAEDRSRRCATRNLRAAHGVAVLLERLLFAAAASGNAATRALELRPCTIIAQQQTRASAKVARCAQDT